MAELFDQLLIFFGITTEVTTFPELFKMVISVLISVYIVLSVLRFLMMFSANMDGLWR